MKKIIIVIFIIGGLFLYNKEENYDNAIRMRVIANSNSESDQKIKNEVVKDLNKEISVILKNSKSLEETRTLLQNNLDKIDATTKTSLLSQNSNLSYNINYGINHFPEKQLKEKTIPAGEYESLVVTLGEGKGNNWWCILFPPLCLLEASESEEVEYSFFLLNLFK